MKDLIVFCFKRPIVGITLLLSVVLIVGLVVGLLWLVGLVI